MSNEQSRLFGHQNDGRKLILEVTVTDGANAGWLWEALVEPRNGIQIRSMADSEQTCEVLECICGTWWKPEMTGSKCCPDCDTWQDR